MGEETGFQRLDLSGESFSSVQRKKAELNWPKVFGLFLSVPLGFFVFFLILIAISYFPAKNLFSTLQKTKLVAQETYQAIKKQDIELGKNKLEELKVELNLIKKNLSAFSWMKFFPFLKDYYGDASHLVEAGESTVEAAIISCETLLPYADLLGLRGQSTFVSGTTEERIRTAVETLDKIIPKLDEISEKISQAQESLEKVNPERYPERVGGNVFRPRLELVKTFFTNTASLFVDAQPLIRRLPELLGTRGPKRYLVLFQNDAELRATGGFITAYALFKLDKGKIQVEKADDIYKLDAAKTKTFSAPSPILKYHKNVSSFELRDSNLSPDFLVSMEEFEKMLKTGIKNFPEFEGIIALDTHVLVSAIRILGEFNVYGRKFSAENDPRCDCPKAIYELEDYATRPVAYVREERKDIIGVLMYEIMQRALGISPSKYWGNLFQMFLDEARQKHILFYFHDKDAQKGIEALNFGGRILPFDGDYLHINNVNFAGAKSNMFVKTFVKQDFYEENGEKVKILTLTYKNPAPPSNCNLEAGQLCLNGVLRNWLRVYVPKGSTLLEFVGSEKPTTTYEELGKTVFEGFLTVKPQGVTEVKIKYKLPENLKKEKFQIFIQKQPGIKEQIYYLYKGEKYIQEFILEEDKKIDFRF